VVINRASLPLSMKIGGDSSAVRPLRATA